MDVRGQEPCDPPERNAAAATGDGDGRGLGMGRVACEANLPAAPAADTGWPPSEVEADRGGAPGTPPPAVAACEAACNTTPASGPPQEEAGEAAGAEDEASDE